MPVTKVHANDHHSERGLIGHEPPRASDLSARRNKNRARVLLVEDEDSFRELLQTFLESEGFNVRSVADGHCGVRWLRANPVDVVITDLCMPNADGIELLMELRRVRSAVPIIAMSGGVAGEMACMLRAAALLGARCTLAKPFPLQQLAAAVHTLIPTAR